MSRGKSNSKNWRANDRKYREQEAARRRANAERRALRTVADADSFTRDALDMDSAAEFGHPRDEHGKFTP